ncbi:MAG: MFS transporter, partial [Chloroflexi bacterium]|nr:MFS transporter [Chloroflexota bacterium]
EEQEAASKQLTRLIAADNVLARRVRRVASIEAAVLAHPLPTIRHAADALGFRAVQSTALACSFIAMLDGECHNVHYITFWRHSVAVAMLALVITDRLEVWHLFTITFFVGMARIFQMPAAQSLAIDSVAPEQINIAVALTTMSQNMNLVIGPLLGGILFELFGAQGAYALIALLYASSGISALFVRTSRVTRTQQMESVIAAVIQALRYVKGQQLIWAALVLAVIINLTGFPFHGTLVPIFARNVLGQDAAGLGLLISGFGIGAGLAIVGTAIAGGFGATVATAC